MKHRINVVLAEKPKRKFWLCDRCGVFFENRKAALSDLCKG